mgnify:CR=1 FL=1
MPTWVENLEPEHWLKKEYFKIIKGMCESVDKIRDIKGEQIICSPFLFSYLPILLTRPAIGNRMNILWQIA